MAAKVAGSSWPNAASLGAKTVNGPAAASVLVSCADPSALRKAVSPPVSVAVPRRSLEPAGAEGAGAVVTAGGSVDVATVVATVVGAAAAVGAGVVGAEVSIDDAAVGVEADTAPLSSPPVVITRPSTATAAAAGRSHHQPAPPRRGRLGAGATVEPAAPAPIEPAANPTADALGAPPAASVARRPRPSVNGSDGS